MTHPRTAVVACMRNEGQFLLEWVAYHRVIGFDEVVVLTNDCDDGMDKMLERLQELGQAVMIHNPREEGQKIQVSGMRRAMAHPVIKSCDWMMHCDADEMVCIHHGEGRIQDLLNAMPGHTDQIAIAWRGFGTGGLTDWEDGNVVEANTWAQKKVKMTAFHKSIFRPNKFRLAIDHMAKAPYAPVVVRNARGERMNEFSVYREHARYRRNGPELMTWEGAAMHHYSVRADDVYMMKNVRGHAMFQDDGKYFVGSQFYNRMNKNEVENRDILRHLDALKAKKAEYLADPVLGPLHAGAVKWFQDLKAEVLTPERRAQWTVTEEAAE